MNRPTLPLSLCLLCVAACDPSAKNAGVVDTQEINAGDPADMTTDSMVLDEGVVTHVVASDNGAVAVIQSGDSPYDMTVVEYDNDLNELWSLYLGQGAINDITEIPGNGFMLGGSNSSKVAAAWHISCCGVLESSDSFPDDVAELSSFIMVQPFDGGALFVRDNGIIGEIRDQDYVKTNLELDVAQTQWVFDMTVIDGAVAPSGNIALALFEDFAGTPNMLLGELWPNFDSEANALGERFMLVGNQADLAVLTYSNPTGVNVRDYAGGPVTAITVPNIVPGPDRVVHADRRDNYAIAHPHPAGDGMITEVVEAYDDGTLARQTMLPLTTLPVAEPTSLAIGNDGAIWVATAETPTGEELLPDMIGALHRLPPL